MTDIIIDVDDVLLDWQGAFAKHYGLDPTGPSTWDLRPWAGPDAHDKVKAFNASEKFKHIPFVPGALDFFDQFEAAALPHRLHILTACGDSNSVVHARLANLRIIDSLITSYRFLPLGASKKEALAQMSPGSILIEDNVGHAQDAVGLGMTAFVFRKNHNRQQELESPADSRLFWIDTWQPVLDYLSHNTGESHEAIHRTGD